MAVDQLALMLNVLPSSRASSLPQVLRFQDETALLDANVNLPLA
ncbi:hypothetical protein BSG18_57120 [Pseudomonas ogarae]|nr:hypothetical protein BSF43_00450 [Pseudomonas ogarae]PBJ16738.1 hypothetical protein BSG18_57120 [Pseudomonas ogarae]